MTKSSWSKTSEKVFNKNFSEPFQVFSRKRLRYSVCLTPIIILLEWKLLIWKPKQLHNLTFPNCFKFVVIKNGCIPDVWPHQSYTSILTQLQNDNNFVNLLSWADSTLWHQGALVKHCKELYKAEGISNAAEPGNSSHTRFYVSILLNY